MTTIRVNQRTEGISTKAATIRIDKRIPARPPLMNWLMSRTTAPMTPKTFQGKNHLTPKTFQGKDHLRCEDKANSALTGMNIAKPIDHPVYVLPNPWVSVDHRLESHPQIDSHSKLFTSMSIRCTQAKTHIRIKARRKIVATTSLLLEIQKKHQKNTAEMQILLMK